MNLLTSYEKRAFKFRSYWNDPTNLSLEETTLAKKTLRDFSLSLKEDRCQEFSIFYNLTSDEAQSIESIHNKQILSEQFNAIETDAGLIRNYQDSSFLYMARLMMAYTRFPVAWRLVQFMNSYYPPSKRNGVRILDYGCGAADYALAFALYGYQITICDIEGGNLDFALWRFKQRNIPVFVIAVKEDNLYPSLPVHDVVISGEFFEHVRDPLQVLQRIHACLPKSGILWHSGYPEDEREVGGDHLREAADLREVTLKYLPSHFKKATRLKLPGYMYRKT